MVKEITSYAKCTEMGSIKVLMIQLSSAKFSKTSGIFNIVVLDAPCSGEGMFRKDSFAIDQWSDSLISQCRKTQTSLLKDSWLLDLIDIHHESC